MAAQFDMLSAVRAVNRKMPVANAVTKFGLSKAQADDLHEHLAARKRLARGGWPTLTPYERYSVYGDNFECGSRQRPIRIVIQQYNDAVTVCSA